MDVHIIPALSDNYIYLFRDPESGSVGVVDPAEAEPVEAELARRGWKLTHIFNTHHHNDHIGGDAALKSRHGCILIGPRAETARIPGMDVLLGDEETVFFGAQEVRFLEVPGHTRGHGAFWFQDAGLLFCGDTLFALGCGRLFEGTPEQMWHSLLKLRDLPPDTRVYCGHEYTLSNARFAVTVDPANPALQARLVDATTARQEGRPTIPTTIGQERATNPFLRADDPAVQQAVGMAGADPARVFGEIRRRKDHF